MSSRANNVRGGRRNISTRTVEPDAPAGGGVGSNQHYHRTSSFVHMRCNSCICNDCTCMAFSIILKYEIVRLSFPRDRCTPKDPCRAYRTRAPADAARGPVFLVAPRTRQLFFSARKQINSDIYSGCVSRINALPCLYPFGSNESEATRVDRGAWMLRIRRAAGRGRGCSD